MSSLDSSKYRQPHGSTCRNRETLHSEGLTNVKFVLLDVTKLTTIDAARATVEAAEGRLDVLVNNAAVSANAQDHRTSSLSANILRSTMETNFYGVVETTSAFMPLIRNSENPVILNVTSGLGSNTWMTTPDAPRHYAAYSATKAALNSYTIHLAHDLATEGVRVNAVTPALTSTRLTGYVKGADTPRDAAQGMLHLALLQKDGPTGKFFGPKGEEFPW